MPRPLFKQLYCEMFAFSAFGRGPHTEYYFILQGEGRGWRRGAWKSLRSEQLLFLITARLFLKRIVPRDRRCEKLRENLFTEGVCEPEAVLGPNVQSQHDLWE